MQVSSWPASVDRWLPPTKEEREPGVVPGGEFSLGYVEAEDTWCIWNPVGLTLKRQILVCVGKKDDF